MTPIEQMPTVLYVLMLLGCSGGILWYLITNKIPKEMRGIAILSMVGSISGILIRIYNLKSNDTVMIGVIILVILMFIELTRMSIRLGTIKILMKNIYFRICLIVIVITTIIMPIIISIVY